MLLIKESIIFLFVYVFFRKLRMKNFDSLVKIIVISLYNLSLKKISIISLFLLGDYISTLKRVCSKNVKCVFNTGNYNFNEKMTIIKKSPIITSPTKFTRYTTAFTREAS